MKGTPMRKTNFSLLSLSIMLLTACTQNVSAQVNEVTPTIVVENAAATATLEVVPHDPPTTCPVTLPQEPKFIPPAPYDALGYKGYFWFGFNSLWTSIPNDGVWSGLPDNPEGYTQKIFWWHDGYVWDQEPEPNLIVVGERIDESAPPLSVSRATNAYADDIGSAMLVGVDFPTLGCWKITGKYSDVELSFVVWVAP